MMNIGIIGFGNLGKSLASGLLNSNIVSAENLFICAKSDSTIETAQSDFNVFASNDVNEIIQKSEIVFLAVKGYVFEEMLTYINYPYFNDKIIVSLMAGITIEKIRSLFERSTIIRAMPSLAISTGNGIIGHTDTNDLIIQGIFKKLGYAIKVDEKDIEKFTALASCGLGFAAYILNAFVLSGVNLGFDEKLSMDIISHTFINAISMSDFDNTIQSVATKGGATEQGLNVFNEKELNDTVFLAVKTAYEKASNFPAK